MRTLALARALTERSTAMLADHQIKLKVAANHRSTAKRRSSSARRCGTTPPAHQRRA